MPRCLLSLIASGAALVLLPAGAQAHTVDAAITCGSVTFSWTAFASSGPVSSVNAPEWQVLVAPSASPVAAGQESFAGTGDSLTVGIPRVNGDITASSRWDANETRDGNAGSGSTTARIRTCTDLSSTASADVGQGNAISDVAHLRGVTPDARGSIVFALYAQRDTTCTAPLDVGTVAVSGSGDYRSPTITPSDAGGYHWTTRFSGDAANAPVGPVGCDDPSEHVDVTSAAPILPSDSGAVADTPATTAAAPSSGVAATAGVTVPASEGTAAPDRCAASAPTVGQLAGVPGQATAAFTARLTASGLARVTFSLDGRTLLTVRSSGVGRRTFRARIDTRTLSHRAHRLRVVGYGRIAGCGGAVRQKTFVRPRSALVAPHFTG